MKYILKLDNPIDRIKVRDATGDSITSMRIQGNGIFGIIPLQDRYVDYDDWHIQFDSEENMTKFIMKYL